MSIFWTPIREKSNKPLMLITHQCVIQPSAPIVAPEWIAKGLTSFFLDGKYYVVGAPATQLAVNGNPVRRMSKHGPCMGFGTTWGSGTTDALIGAPLPPPISRKRSLFAIGYAQTQSGVLFTDQSVTQLSSKEAIWWGTGDSVTLFYLTQTTGGYAQYGPSNSTIPASSWWTYGMSHDRSVRNAPTFFVNGTKRTTLTTFAGSGSYVDGTTNMMLCNRWEGYDQALSGMFVLLLFFDGYLSDTDHVSLHANPWQVFAKTQSFPILVPVDAEEALHQLLVAVGDIDKGLWTPSSGSDLYAMLDEVSASDSDFIVATSPTSCEIRLAEGAQPQTAGEYTLSYRLLDGTGSVSATLKQGATTIASWGPHPLTSAPQTFNQTLTAGQIAALTDYSDLRVAFEAQA